MDTRHIHRLLNAAVATLVASASIAGAGPTVIVERISTPEQVERLAVGFEARALCVRIVAEATGDTVRLQSPRGCSTCRRI